MTHFGYNRAKPLVGVSNLSLVKEPYKYPLRVSAFKLAIFYLQKMDQVITSIPPSSAQVECQDQGRATR